MCARQMTGTPFSTSGPTMPAVCGSCRRTTSRGRYALRQQVGVLGGDALVDGALGLAQRPAVAGVAVQAVVQALGDAEELGVAADGDPSRVDADAAHVADERAQHLGDAAAMSGGVHVPERPPVQQLTPAGHRVLELRQAVGGKDVAEARRIERRDRDIVQGARHDPTRDAGHASVGQASRRRPVTLDRHHPPRVARRDVSQIGSASRHGR